MGEPVRHLMVCTYTDEQGRESLFECTECARRLMFDHERARLIIIKPGDEFALHNGSTGLVTLSAHLGGPGT